MMDASPFSKSLAERLNACNIKVTENCNYWKPVAIVEDGEYYIGHALNQYFVQEKITHTNNATLWLCYDILTNELCCMKVFYITACQKERSVRFFKDDTEVITLLDKIIDEMLYHSSVYNCPGVSKVKDVIVNLEDDVIYFIMSYYPSQLLYYDCHDQRYYGPYNHSLYNEFGARTVLRELIYTIQYLHDNGIIHKDIKPENILLKKIDSSLFEAKRIESPVDDSFIINSSRKISLSDLNTIKTCRKSNEFVSQSPPTSLDTLKCSLIHNFPYNPIVTSDFDWCLWDEVELKCDWIRFDNEVKIGKNAYDYAMNILDKSRRESTVIFEYFTREDSPIPYKINRNFIKSNGVDNTEYKYPTNEHVVITDFSVTSLAEFDQLEPDKLVIYDSEGTLAFNSPESLKYIEGNISARERDVFSLGVTLYCMIYGKLPYSGNNSIQILINMLEEPLSFETLRPVSQELSSLLLQMLDKNYKNRISLDKILTHPWMTTM